MVDFRKRCKGGPGEKRLSSGRIALLARFILGTIFIYAAVGKIGNPRAFAETVYNYQILPHLLVNLTAIILPWVEITLGFSLILGICLRGAVVLSNLLLLCFLGLIVFNMIRGLDIHCGCFSLGVQGTKHAPMGWYITRDSLFLLPAWFLWHHTSRKRREKVRK